MATTHRSSGAYARYIGRVGVLAVALGVGAAVTGLGGVAWAEETDTGTDTTENNAETTTDTEADTTETDAADSADDTDGGAAADQPDSAEQALAPERPRVPWLTSSRFVEQITEVFGLSPGENETPIESGGTETSTAVIIPESDTPSDVESAEVTPAGDLAAAASSGDLTPITDVVVRQQEPLLRTTNPVVVQTFSLADLPTAAVTIDSITDEPSPVAAPANPIATFVGTVLSVFGIGSNAAATDTPLLPGFSIIVGAIELIRREIEYAFFRPAPVVADQEITLDQGETQTITLPGRDANGTPVTYTVTDPPAKGTVGTPTLGSDGNYTITYTAAGDAEPGADSFVVTASDANSGFHLHGLASLFAPNSAHTDTATVNVTIEDANDPPQIASVTPGTVDPGDGSITYTVAATDDSTPPEALTVTTTQPQDGSGTVSTPEYDSATQTWSFTYTPSAQERVNAYSTTAVETDQFSVTVSDGDEAASQAVMPTVDATQIAQVGTIVVYPGNVAGPTNTFINPNNGHVYATVIRYAEPDDDGQVTRVAVSVVDIDNDNALVGEAYELPVSALGNDAAGLFLVDPVVDADGNVYLSRPATDNDPAAVVVIHGDGSPDTEIAVDGPVTALAVSPDGSAVYGKVLTTSAGQPLLTVVQLDPDSSTATPLGDPIPVAPNSALYWDTVYSGIVVDDDGNVYALGNPRINGAGDLETDLVIFEPAGEENVVTIPGAVTELAADGDGNHIFVKRLVVDLAQQQLQTEVVDITTGDVVVVGQQASVPPSSQLYAMYRDMEVSADGTRVVLQDVPDNDSIPLTIIDTQSDTVILSTVGAATEYTFSEDGALLYTTRNNTVIVRAIADPPPSVV